MDLIASFSGKKVRKAYFFNIYGLFGQKVMPFLFDTGAARSVVGTRSFFSAKEITDYDVQIMLFEKILREEIILQSISPWEDMETVNGQKVTVYPCMCHNVSIENVPMRDFYFDISFDMIKTPLLGSAYTDDCAYSHSIGGNLTITAMKDNAGNECYKDVKSLEFRTVVERYQKELKIAV